MTVDLTRFRRFGAVFALVFALAACAAPDNRVDRPLPTFAEPAAAEVIAVGFDNIADKYIKPVALKRVGIEGLRGLGAIDAALTLKESGDEIVMYENGHEIGRMRLPPESDVRAWAGAIVALTENARSYSPEIGRASAEKIYQAIFDGALSDLDIFSRYAGTAEASRNRAKRDGFGGIGIRFRIADGAAVVTKVIPETPAATSGLRPGDRIVRVEDRDVAGLAEGEVTRLIRGPVATPVRLTLERPEAVQPFAIDVARAHIVPESVVVKHDNGIAVIRITSFNQRTAASLERALRQLTAPGTAPPAGIVLDLRGNPGGLLRQSVEVSDLLLTQGDILRTVGRHPDSLHHYTAGGDDLAAGLPLVVLVDGKSASAAEIVAAALQDRNRAVVVGTSSYGKGSVQTVIRLPNDGEITLTWSRFQAPSGYYLHGLGVVPTVCTSGRGNDDDAAGLIQAALADANGTPLALQRRALLDEDERQALRASCPSESRPGPLDLQIAKRLILDQRLHSRALRRGTATVQAAK